MLMMRNVFLKLHYDVIPCMHNKLVFVLKQLVKDVRSFKNCGLEIRKNFTIDNSFRPEPNSEIKNGGNGPPLGYN